jgi:hypothetical protein
MACVLALGGSLAASSSAMAADQITVTSFSLSSRLVDTTQYGATATATIHVVDAAANITTVGLFGPAVDPAPGVTGNGGPILGGFGKLTSGTAHDGVWTVPITLPGGYSRTFPFTVQVETDQNAVGQDVTSQLVAGGFPTTITTHVSAAPGKVSNISTQLTLGHDPYYANWYWAAATTWSNPAGSAATTYYSITSSGCGSPASSTASTYGVGPAAATGGTGFISPPLVSLCKVTVTTFNDAGSATASGSSVI